MRSFTARFRRGRSRRERKETSGVVHEGIKTVTAGNLCEFSGKYSDLCICILTWNMNNGQVQQEELEELVGSDRRFDLLVVGLQEVPRSDISRLFEQTLAQSNHVLIGKSVMQSLHLYVFGPTNSDLFIKELKVDKHSLGGCGGLIGRKKGAVAACLSYKGIRMVFISCHLSAHLHKVEERNSECRHISHSLFSKNRNPYATPAHLTVWLGDLNYRLQGIDNYPARSLIHKDLHTTLTSKDQLLQEAGRGEIFEGYCEGSLSFKPTYKYNVGTSNYDTSYKVRVPAWTDRILFKIYDVDRIQASLHSYESVDEVYSSDHKPVKAHLCLTVLDKLH